MMQKANSTDFNLSKLWGSLNENGFVFFDLETSGLSPIVHEIVEIAAIKISKSGEYERFQTLVRPSKKLTQANIDIHGITNKDLEPAPSIEEVLPKFIDFIEDYGLVAYNAQFDVGFLSVDLWKHKISYGKNFVYDAFLLAKACLKFQKEKAENLRLETLATHFGFEGRFHRAMDDSEACLHVIAELLDKLSEQQFGKIDLDKQFKQFSLKSLRDKDIIIDQRHELIKEALETGNEIKIIYKGGSKGRIPRPVKPIALLPLPTGLMLYAHCLKDDHSKAFNFKKILEVKKKDA